MPTTQEGPGGIKTSVLRQPTAAEIQETKDQVLIPEKSVVNRVGKRGFQ
jgi:hypothetical protein